MESDNSCITGGNSTSNTGSVTAAIVLAGGYSSRMKRFKALLPLGGNGETVFDTVISSLRRGGIEHIAVVTGYERELLMPLIKKWKCKEAYNPDFYKGMFSSIKTGLQFVTDMWISEDFQGKSGCFLVPVDCPLFGEETLKQMKQRVENLDGKAFVVAAYRGKKGHPLYIPVDYFGEILGCSKEGGLKSVTDKYFNLMERVEIANAGVVMDMDTWSEYEEVLNFYNGGCISPNLVELGRDRRIILIRHGQIKQHSDKIFLGQVDVELSDLGRSQAEALKAPLKELGIRADKVYTSDLARARQTAECLTYFRIETVPEFREIKLGDWDGCIIAKVKEQWPEEFALRGENIWTYKKGRGSENFFDLQYRVVKRLSSILLNDRCEDIVIVAHKGVLRVIETNLMGGDVTDLWEEIPVGKMKVIYK